MKELARRAASSFTIFAFVACGGEASSPAPKVPEALPVAEVRAPVFERQEPPPSVASPPQISPPSGDEGIPSRAARHYPSPLPPPKRATIPLSREPGDKADAALAAGDAAFDQGDYVRARQSYSEALRRARLRAGPVVGLARVRVASVKVPFDYGAGKGNRELRAVARELGRAAKLEPVFGPAHVELGRVLLLMGEGNAALESLRKGTQLCEGEAEAHSAYGIALLAVGRTDDALAAMTKAVELDPGSAPRHGNLGTVFLMRGRVEEAVEEYELQVRIAPGDAMAHADLGAALLAAGDVARGAKELEAAVRMDASRATFHTNLGYALALLGKLAESEAQHREALRLDPKFGGAWINLATVLAKDPQRRGEARTALEKARSIDPTDPRVHANLDELNALERSDSSPAH